MFKFLIVDNYDSFTFNLYQYAGEVLEEGAQAFDLNVKRNDELSLREIKKENYRGIIISPGPGTASDRNYFGLCSDILQELGPSVPILGVCLGMQGMASVFGGKICRAKTPVHGKTSLIENDGEGLFQNIPKKIRVMRYHSLVVEPQSLPECLKVSAWSIASKEGGEEKEIMALRHHKYPRYPMEGIQFHPESFATEAGKEMIANFIHFSRSHSPSR